MFFWRLCKGLKLIVDSVTFRASDLSGLGISSIIYGKAKGGDNWPLTWTDDDNLYTVMVMVMDLNLNWKKS
jgi:hypothetical protein